MNKKAQAYEDLKRRIISLELPPGSPVNEAEIAQLLGVSKTPLREALMQLERDGFVEIVPARGSSISQITADDVEDMLQIREIIEAGVARRIAAAGGSPELVRERVTTEKLLRSENAQGEKVFEWGPGEDVHQMLIEALNNRILASLYGRLIERITRIRNYYGDKFTRRRVQDIAAEHAAILDAVAGGDGSAAERMMIRHLQNARTFLGGVNEQGGGD